MASSSDDDIQSEQNEWEDWHDQDDDGEEATHSLFDGAIFPSPDAALDYDSSTHGFDLRHFRIQVTPPPPMWRQNAHPTDPICYTRHV